MRKLSIIIPAYNEEARIQTTLENIVDFLSCQAFNSEIVIVDDASVDNTFEIIKEVKYPQHKITLTVLQHVYNKGKGAAVKTGVAAAAGDYILLMDADNSTEIKEIKKFLPHIRSHKIIIGSRYVNKDSIRIKQPLLRRIISRSGNLFIKLLFKLNFSDTQCGFKLLEANAAKQIFGLVKITRWAFDIEMLIIARELSIPIAEIAVIWNDSAGSKLRAGRAAVNTLKEVILIKKNLRSGKYTCSIPKIN